MTADRAPIAVARTADRRRLQVRIRELSELAELMRQPGGMAEVPEPVPLHRASRNTTTERTTTS